MARKGAEQTYKELTAAMTQLVKDYPHLAAKANKQVSRAVARGAASVGAEASRTKRRARTMSAAARKAVSLRMKKYWADRRASAKK